MKQYIFLAVVLAVCPVLLYTMPPLKVQLTNPETLFNIRVILDQGEQNEADAQLDPH